MFAPNNTAIHHGIKFDAVMRSRIIGCEHSADDQWSPLPHQILSIGAHHFTVAKLISVSILGGGRAGALPFSLFVLHRLSFIPRWQSFKLLSAVPFRLCATVPNVEPPFDGSTRLKISSGRPFPMKVLRGCRGPFPKVPLRKTPRKKGQPRKTAVLRFRYSFFNRSATEQ